MTACESLNSQFSWLLLLWLANLSAHTVSNLYFVINTLMNTSSWDLVRWSFVHCIVWWIIAFIVQLLLLNIACHFTSVEVFVYSNFRIIFHLILFSCFLYSE